MCSMFHEINLINLTVGYQREIKVVSLSHRNLYINLVLIRDTLITLFINDILNNLL